MATICETEAEVRDELEVGTVLRTMARREG